MLFVPETQYCCYLFKCLVIYSIKITDPEAPPKVWEVEVIWVQFEVSQERAPLEMKSSYGRSKFWSWSTDTSTVRGTALKPRWSTSPPIILGSVCCSWISVFNQKERIWRGLNSRSETSFDVYIFVEMPLNTGSYFFICPLQPACQILLLKKLNNHW